jgi:hypothetical protein
VEKERGAMVILEIVRARRRDGQGVGGSLRRSSMVGRGRGSFGDGSHSSYRPKFVDAQLRKSSKLFIKRWRALRSARQLHALLFP